MTITAEQKNGALTLHIAGRLDTVTSPELESKINKLPSDTVNLVLDMKDVGYVSSAGLRVLLGAQKKMSKCGSMKLTGVCDAVTEVLEMTGFSDILEIE